ncbi:hypothetical protein SS50377_22478 [Spironucleus salmonicida]|uniref:Uncharacterized protein n=1 Tax=Spironucleus salmonicida TaxID=348837 RepID=V6LC36_9EUKA|nr:hypothetical protein SS50377_22478 [Spironucleus salmonicida]|eukprot:EST42032.1 Hypothetical protein SS50377_18339 [Spironucleus salmonicida]
MQHILNIDYDEVQDYFNKQNQEIELNNIQILTSKMNIFKNQQSIYAELHNLKPQASQVSNNDFKIEKDNEYFTNLKNTQTKLLEVISDLQLIPDSSNADKLILLQKIRTFLSNQPVNSISDIRHLYRTYLQAFVSDPNNYTLFFGSFQD